MTAFHIDWTACDGRGLCAELVPEVFDRDEWGFPVGRDGRPEVPRDASGRARRAVRACPRLALSLVDSDVGSEPTAASSGH
ncbi:ferredoxin [Williamsia sp. MIQD14]|uniref:ferredoxin n=1 Tax=Williamsia sp. MIQD14 TaxID=3425703 RepID=UPI003DA01575